ncbi:hypothetical protein H310_12219 [Aphanomyces invadans]|uniref:DDE Tnp4 domain-containing protein n=1 Tax=Aphanomyces invadans TaxID=157072 RepID=A0A024TJU3_9STRA|nr:hypothetical protein H310_12219 [Aphanomyces invadans]ETV93871.1 hypothetical protein H310_12219 [Aphanomyces invadans]|eukprot:XP_008877431.1 hypothetical protein H310_12219 [Aphanomyces invadans]
MCVLLKRLRYPISYYDLIATFGRSREQLCRIFNYMVQFVYDRWKSVIYCNTKIVRSRIGHATSNGAEGLNLQKRI